MTTIDPRNIVESYLNLRSSRQYDQLEKVLSENVEYESPLSTYNSSVDLVSDMIENSDEFEGALNVKKVFVDGDDVCAIYEQKCTDPSVGDVTFTEWYKVSGNRIAMIRSTFDTRSIVESRSQI